MYDNLDIGLQELRAGQTLATLQHVTAEMATRIASDLARILARAHALGIAHCDVSPDNVLIDETGTVTLIDWELAAALDQPSAPGTLGYTPPEAWSGSCVARPERDTYALAVLIWECIEGRRAFHGTRDDVINAQRLFQFDTQDIAAPVVSALFGAARDRSPIPRETTDLYCEIDATRVAARGTSSAIADSLFRLATSTTLHVDVPALAAGQPIDPGCAAALALASVAYPVQLADISVADIDGDQRRCAAPSVSLGDLLAHCDETTCIAIILDDMADPGQTAMSSVLRIITLSTPVRRARMNFVRARAVSPSTNDITRLRDFAVGPVFHASENTDPGSLWNSSAQGPAPDYPSMESRVSNLPALLQQSQLAVVAGQPNLAYRALVRLTTTYALSDLEDADLLQVAYCWSEVGVPDAVIPLVDFARGESTKAHVARYALRSLASASRIAELREALSRYSHLDLGIDLARHRAILLTQAREPGRALDALEAYSTRDAAAAKDAGVLFLITRASALRLTGRPWSARRNLRLAEQLAKVRGARRLELLARSNTLLLNYDIGHRDEVAASWEQHAEACESWGLRGDAAIALVRVGAHWIEVGQAARGLRHLDRADAMLAGTVRSRSRWAQQSRVYRTWALDRLEDWHEVSPSATSDLGCDERSVYDTLLRWELYGRMPHLGVAAAGDTTPVPGVRAVRATVREFFTRGASSRGFRLLGLAHRCFDEASPIPMCLTRLVFATVPQARDQWVLDHARTSVVDSDGAPPSDLATVVVAVASGHVPSQALAQRLLAFLDSRGEDRWPGVRRWEWALASSVAKARAVDGHDLAVGLAAAEGLLTRLAARIEGDRPTQAVMRGSGVIETLRSALLGQRTTPLGDRCETTDRRMSFIDRVVGRGMDAVLQECGREAIRLTGAERAVVIFDLGDGRGRAHIAGLTPVMGDDQLQVCQSVLARADESGNAILLDDAVSDPALRSRPSVKRYQPRSLVVAPMQCGDRRVGYVYAETRSRARGMGAAELKALSSASFEFAWSLEAAYLRGEQSRLRDEFERARSELARARGLEAIGRSTSEIIHELRNLLTVVVGESDLLAVESLSDTARSSVSNIACAARDGCNVISRLQSTVRGLPANETETIDLHGLLTEVLLVSRVRVANARNGAGIAVALNGMAGQMVVGVASELREVFSNLVANAIDAMPNGGTLSVAVSRADGYIMVSVSDTGYGMSEEVRARAMEPFFTTKGSRGNGLGLAIVQGILTKHGGTIEVQSELGVGSTFAVRLPQARADLGTSRWLENTVVDSSRG